MQDYQELIKDDFDREYIILLEEIENRLNTISRHDLVRLTAWVKNIFII